MSKKHKKHNQKTNKQHDNSSSEQEYIKDTSPIVYQKGKLKSELHIRIRPDLTEKQKELLALINSKECKMIFVEGPAGTSKSFVSIMAALQLLNNRKVSDIVYLRSVVESSDFSIGFLPGSESDKVGPFLLPFVDKLNELLPPQEIDMLMKDERIQGHPINFIRGAHWAVKCVICDEAQNLSYHELVTLVTRAGEYSKFIIISDSDQTDIKSSGIKKMMDNFDDDESKSNGIYKFQFTEDDCVRSQLVKFILKRLKNKK